MAHAQIINGKLSICSNGSVQSLGIYSIRKAIKHIEGSRLVVKKSTADILSVYKDAIKLWDARVK